MRQRIITIVLGVLVLVLSCTTAYFAAASVSTDKNVLVKNYTNETYGYEFLYPSFFTLDDTKPGHVDLSNNSCQDNAILCILGISLVRIDVRDNSDGLSLNQYYEKTKMWGENCKLISIFALPENFNDDELVKAVRCEFEEAPKQEPGGYGYTIFNADKIFDVTFFQGEAYIPDGNLAKLTDDQYDPLGDEIMRTFKFTK